MVGAKLQVIITKLGLSIQDRGDVVKGAPVVQPGDDLFWFGRPRFLLFLIHVVLFTVILLRLCLFMDSFNLPTFNHHHHCANSCMFIPDFLCRMHFNWPFLSGAR